MLGVLGVVGAEVIGVSPSVLGVYFATVAVGYMIGNFLSGRFSQSWGIEPMMVYGGIVACMDTQTGKTHFDGKRLGVRGEFYASPMRVGDKILLASASGTVAVLQDGEDFELLAKNDLGEGVFATPAAVEGTLYVRSEKHLWAFASGE